MSTEGTSPAQIFRIDRIVYGGEPPPLGLIARQPWYPWLIVGITCLGAFIGQLDASIVQLALPSLASKFHATLESVSWVALAYLVAYAALLPIFGRLCEMFGRKLLYLCGFFVFVLATALCGFAGNLAWLVVFRALQGVGGALLGANSISILSQTAGQARRGCAMGIFAAAQAIGLSLGPAIGGILLQAYGWRWIFWVTVPFGAAAILLGLLALPQTEGLAQKRVFDWWGAVLLTPALVTLVLALNQVSALGLDSPLLMACLGAAVVLIAGFARRERRFASPLVDLQLFSSPAFSCGAAGVVVGYALLYGMFFLISFALIRGYHLPEAVAGLRITAIPVAIGIIAPLSGLIADRLGSRPVRVVGMALCLAALVVLSAIAPEKRVGLVIGLSLLALLGVGIALFIAPQQQRDDERGPIQPLRRGGRIALPHAQPRHQPGPRRGVLPAVMAISGADRGALECPDLRGAAAPRCGRELFRDAYGLLPGGGQSVAGSQLALIDPVKWSWTSDASRR